MVVFQVLRVYCGLLVVSPPVIMWNVIAVLFNFLIVGAYSHFAGTEKEGFDS